MLEVEKAALTAGRKEARLSRARARAKTAGMQNFLEASYQECILHLSASGKLQEFYTAFPEYRADVPPGTKPAAKRKKDNQ
ncbi:MAG: hypothetical protein OXG56_07215 [Gammaproteobacteria bacterium]|nr:hypothetical protein [Gammaproteobacteria bacterium]